MEECKGREDEEAAYGRFYHSIFGKGVDTRAYSTEYERSKEKGDKGE